MREINEDCLIMRKQKRQCLCLLGCDLPYPGIHVDMRVYAHPTRVRDHAPLGLVDASHMTLDMQTKVCHGYRLYCFRVFEIII